MDYLEILQYGSVAGLFVAGGFAGLQRGTIVNLREANTDLRSRRDDLEKDRDDAVHERERDRQASAKKIADLEVAVRTLTDTVTAKDSIDDLSMRLDQHHSESMEVLQGIRQALMSRGE